MTRRSAISRLFLPYAVVDQLRERGPATVEDLAERLSVDAQTVRFHLRRAEAWNLVAVLTRLPRSDGGRGAGRRVYGLHDSLSEPVRFPARRAA